MQIDKDYHNYCITHRSTQLTVYNHLPPIRIYTIQMGSFPLTFNDSLFIHKQNR